MKFREARILRRRANVNVMSTPAVDQILESALRLDAQQRAALADRLLASLEELDEEESERLWASEAERRLLEYQAGRARAIPSQEVAAKVERLLR